MFGIIATNPKECIMRITIPVEEFKERVAKAAKLVADKGLDVLVVNGS